MRGTLSRLREWVKGVASIGDLLEATWLAVLVAAIVIGGLFVAVENLLRWLQ